MTRRTDRIGNLIRNTIGEILLSKLSDPRIDPGKTSITRVEVLEDLLSARVYVSVMGSEGEQRRTVQALAHAAGHIQELMARQISLRTTPTLDFRLDENFKKTLQTYAIIDQAMRELREKDAQQQADNADEQQQGDDQQESNQDETGSDDDDAPAGQDRT